MKHILSILLSFAACLEVPAADFAVEKNSRERLQAVLDGGADLVLSPRSVYEVDGELVIKKEGQKVYTKNAKSPADYAVIKLVGDAGVRVLNALGVKGAELKNVAFDGSRYDPHAVGGRDSLVQMGGHGGDFQKVENCVFMNGRGWSLLHFFEPAQGAKVCGNFFFSSGLDCRGGGAYSKESFPAWGDGISFAAWKSAVENNVIIDPTDVGIVVYCCPESTFKNNVVLAVSRESLGGIGMVDDILLYETAKGSKRYNYRGVKLLQNYVEAMGARVHIAYAVGKHTWGPGPGTYPPGKSGVVLLGGESRKNEVSGLCAGYGFAVSGAEGFTIKDNISTASYSRMGDGLTYKKPDEPCAFIYDPETVKDCELQKEFAPCKSHIIHLLACNFGVQRPAEEGGFRQYPYGDFEAQGAVNTAYLEMLGRAPTPAEIQKWKKELNEKFLPADAIRKSIIASPEFERKFGKVPAEDLHKYRAKIWLDAFNKESAKPDWETLPAKERAARLFKSVSTRARP